MHVPNGPQIRAYVQARMQVAHVAGHILHGLLSHALTRRCKTTQHCNALMRCHSVQVPSSSRTIACLLSCACLHRVQALQSEKRRATDAARSAGERAKEAGSKQAALEAKLATCEKQLQEERVRHGAKSL